MNQEVQDIKTPSFLRNRNQISRFQSQAKQQDQEAGFDYDDQLGVPLVSSSIENKKDQESPAPSPKQSYESPDASMKNNLVDDVIENEIGSENSQGHQEEEENPYVRAPIAQEVI